MAEGKNHTGAPSPFEHGLPLGNLTAGLAAQMPNFPDVTGIRPSRTSRSERPQPATKEAVWLAHQPCGGLPNSPHSAQGNPATLCGAGDAAPQAWQSDYLAALPGSLPSDRAALRGIPCKMCPRKEGLCRRRGETSRHRTSCQRHKTHAPVYTPVAAQLRLSQPQRGTYSPTGGPSNAHSVAPPAAGGSDCRLRA